jgi:hypothetical protein
LSTGALLGPEEALLMAVRTTDDLAAQAAVLGDDGDRVRSGS